MDTEERERNRGGGAGEVGGAETRRNNVMRGGGAR